MSEIQSCDVRVTGVVQGVGFRPWIHTQATQLQLCGQVRNTADGLSITVEGAPAALRAFADNLQQRPPQHAHITSVTITPAPPRHASDFRILQSTDGAITTDLPPDLATCPACLCELRNPADRRHGYSVISCTQCGPRQSICLELPWDRASSSMSAFAQCLACQSETRSPTDRRFHSQTNACPTCGPSLHYRGPHGGNPLEAACATLEAGQILAFKGIGGFQLMVDAQNPQAVERLRLRKRRSSKPLAILYPDLAAIERHCQVTPSERAILSSPAAPIVLLRPRHRCASSHIGAMLPCTPLHHLLLDQLQRPLIATSGNVSGETICISNDEAIARLAQIADAWLMHNRDIVEPLDDSIVIVIDEKATLIRRARGYPQAIPFHAPPGGPVLALGGQLKNTLAASRGDRIVLSQHIGDLTTLATRQTHEQLRDRIAPAHPTVVCDLHPDYATTLEAERLDRPTVRVQHHEAHAWAGVAEHSLTQPCLAIIWDGTGYGHDGTIWGGESFVIRDRFCERVSTLRPFPLLGGEAAIQSPDRIAYALLRSCGLPCHRLGFAKSATHILDTQLATGLNSPQCSAMGRLFDAVSALIGLIKKVEYEGHAAMALEHAISPGQDTYPITLDGMQADWRPLIRAICADLDAGTATGTIAARFHRALVALIVQIAQAQALPDVLLSGGCFQNRSLLTEAIASLRHARFTPHWPQLVPPNDGGIAVGQLIASRTRGLPCV